MRLNWRSKPGASGPIYAADPAAKPGPALCRAAEPDPQRLPPRLRPHHPFQPRSGAWRTRRKCSSITRATITARGSPIRSRSRRSPARSRARSGSTRTSPRRWRWRTISAIRRSATPASARSTTALGRFGGFDHNAQALRIVTDLERRYAAFDGLNLTWETLEGLVKHNGPLTDRAGQPIGRYAEHGVPAPILAYNENPGSGAVVASPSAEAQVAALADDIAYDAHDIDDGLRADLFTLDDIAAVGIVGDIVREIGRQHPGLDPARRAHETVRRLITRMIEDVIAETSRRVAVAQADARRSAQGRRVRWSHFRRRCKRPTPTSRAFSIRACTGTIA